MKQFIYMIREYLVLKILTLAIFIAPMPFQLFLIIGLNSACDEFRKTIK